MSTDGLGARDPLRVLTEETFSANQFEGDHEELFRSLFAQIKDDLQARPGFHTLHEMLAERAAHAFVLLKQKDASPNGMVLHMQDYERLNKILLGAIDRLLNEAKLEDATEADKRQTARTLVRVYVESIERLPLTSEDRIKALQDFEAHVAEHMA